MISAAEDQSFQQCCCGDELPGASWFKRWLTPIEIELYTQVIAVRRRR